MEAAKHEVTIRERAYAIWEAEGCPDGREWDHWERASHEVLSRSAVQESETAAPKPKVRKTVKSRIRSAFKSAMPA